MPNHYDRDPRLDIPDIGKMREDRYESDRIAGINASYGPAIANELIKSYGFSVDPVTGEFGGWSVDTIKDAFSESPVLTTIDYLTLAVPVARWGVAAGKVASGAGATSKAYKASKVGFREAVTATQKAGIPMTKLGRQFSNPVADDMTDYLRIAKDADVELGPGELRHLGAMKKREMIVEQNYIERTANDLIRETGRLDSGKNANISKLLERGAKPEDALTSRVLKQDEAALRAYDKTYQFRNALHEESYDLGLIGEETYLKNLGTYNPRLYKEHQDAVAKFGKAGKPGKPGADRFKARTAEEHPELTQIFSGALSVDEMAKASQLVATERFAVNLSKSALVKTGDDLLGYISKLDNPNVRKAYGVSDELYEGARGLDKTALQGAKDKILEKSGWRRGKDVLKVKNNALDDMWIDPNAAEELDSVFQIAKSGYVSTVEKSLKTLYSNIQGTFRASKTAYNPATHVRNVLGAAVFHSFSTGSARAFTGVGLKNGVEMYAKRGDSYQEALRAGVIGTSYDKELQDIMRAAGSTSASGRATAMDWLGDSKISSFIKGGAGKAERVYRAIDEVAKLDAFDFLVKKYMKNPAKWSMRNRQDAIAKASSEIHKYTPNFMMHNPVADVLRKHVPFASFATESVRVWGNLMTHKPHLAFFWTNQTDVLSYGIGAMNGYSVAEVDAAKEALPSYTKNKKMVMVPFKVNDRPSFADLSYLLPMGNIVELETAENLMFGLVDPTQNPVFSFIAAGATGVNPFSGQKIAPNLTEKQLGIPVKGEQMRMAVGMAEYTMGMMVPPLFPGGYAGTNLLELARGQVNPDTDQSLEKGWASTIAANVFGFRTYEPSVRNIVQNVKQEEREIQAKIKQARDRWTWAMANGDEEGAQEAKQEILEQRDLLDGKGREYFDKNSENWRGPIRGVSNRQLDKAEKRARSIDELGDMTPEDKVTRRAMTRKRFDRKR